jgi:predicted GNAT family acetyltransferase
VLPLEHENKEEVLAFLAERPLHTAIMAGWIRDNGVVSPLNRGTYYGCRDDRGRLQGVALIGHATLFDARSDAALAAFAQFAKSCTNAHMLLGEKEQVARFWEYYSDGGQAPARICRELLFEQRWPVEVREAVEAMRLATSDDLELVMPVQAEMAYEESGVNPLEKDPQGFRSRCARRIEQGRTWVWVEEGRLIFKAEVVSDTPEVSYLEGVWVSPEERGNGFALRCMSQLTRTLLNRAPSVSILVNEQNHGALQLYRRAGFKLMDYFDTIFLNQRRV